MTIFKPSPDRTLNIAVFIALLFHFSGFIGMNTPARDWFISMTPLTLSLMAVLLFVTESNRGKALYGFFILCFLTGFIAELIGVNTGTLFGDYAYGSTMGIKWMGVPLLIGLQWFVTIYSVGHLTSFIFLRTGWNANPTIDRNWNKAILGAGITTLFDFILEPAAIDLGYWHWLPDGEIPICNYVCWFFISAILQYSFFRIKMLSTQLNMFAIILLFIQSIFFMLL